MKEYIKLGSIIALAMLVVSILQGVVSRVGSEAGVGTPFDRIVPSSISTSTYRVIDGAKARVLVGTSSRRAWLKIISTSTQSIYLCMNGAPATCSERTGQLLVPNPTIGATVGTSTRLLIDENVSFSGQIRAITGAASTSIYIVEALY